MPKKRQPSTSAESGSVPPLKIKKQQSVRLTVRWQSLPTAIMPWCHGPSFAAPQSSSKPAPLLQDKATERACPSSDPDWIMKIILILIHVKVQVSVHLYCFGWPRPSALHWYCIIVATVLVHHLQILNLHLTHPLQTQVDCSLEPVFTFTLQEDVWGVFWIIPMHLSKTNLVDFINMDLFHQLKHVRTCNAQSVLYENLVSKTLLDLLDHKRRTLLDLLDHKQRWLLLPGLKNYQVRLPLLLLLLLRLYSRHLHGVDRGNWKFNQSCHLSVCQSVCLSWLDDVWIAVKCESVQSMICAYSLQDLILKAVQWADLMSQVRWAEPSQKHSWFLIEMATESNTVTWCYVACAQQMNNWIKLYKIKI